MAVPMVARVMMEEMRRRMGRSRMGSIERRRTVRSGRSRATDAMTGRAEGR